MQPQTERPTPNFVAPQSRDPNEVTLRQRLGMAVFSVMIACALLKLTLTQVSATQQDEAMTTDDAVHYLAEGFWNHFTALNCDASVEGESLVLEDGNGLIHTQTQFRDFVLELEWRPMKDSEWDSGIYFRCDLPEEGRNWPRRYQVNLKENEEGSLIGFQDARVTGLSKPGEWNHLKLVVKGEKAHLEINQELAWETSGLDDRWGYIGIQSEVPLGGGFEFRAISLTELTHRPLFNGSDLEGWELTDPAKSECWQVQDGNLVCTGLPGAWLRSEEEFDDFNLRLEYKLKEGGNSGVYLRVPRDGNHHGEGSGIEVQILDDHHPRYEELKPYQYSASLYAIREASERPSRTAGEWNQLEIDCRGHRYSVWLNGVQVIATDEEQTPELLERRVAGFLGLQNHSEEVHFRRIRIAPSRHD